MFRPEDVHQLGESFLRSVVERSSHESRIVKEIHEIVRDEAGDQPTGYDRLVQLLKELGAYVQDSQEQEPVLRSTLCCLVGSSLSIPGSRCLACARVACMQAFRERLKKQTGLQEGARVEQARLQAEVDACLRAVQETSSFRGATPRQQQEVLARTSSRVRSGNLRPAEIKVLRRLEVTPRGAPFAHKVPWETLQPAHRALRIRRDLVDARLASTIAVQQARVRVPTAEELLKDLTRRAGAGGTSSLEALVTRLVARLVDRPQSPLAFMRGFVKAVELGRLRGPEPVLSTIDCIGRNILASAVNGRRYSPGVKKTLLRLTYKGGLGILDNLIALGLVVNRRTVQRWRRDARLPYAYGGRPGEEGYERQVDRVCEHFGYEPRGAGAVSKPQAVVCVSMDDTALRRKLEVTYTPAGRGPSGWGAKQDGWCLWGLAGGPVYKLAEEAPDSRSAFAWFVSTLQDPAARLATDLRLVMVTASGTRREGSKRVTKPLFIDTVSREGDWNGLLKTFDLLSNSLLRRGLHPGIIAADHAPSFVRAALHRMRCPMGRRSGLSVVPHHLCSGLEAHRLTTGGYQVYIGDWYHLNQLLAIGILRPTSVLAFGGAALTASRLNEFLHDHRAKLGDRAIASQDLNESRKQDYPRSMRFAGKDFRTGGDLPGSMLSVMRVLVDAAAAEPGGRRVGWAGLWLYFELMNDLCSLFERRPMSVRERALLALRVIACVKIWRVVTDSDTSRKVATNMPSLAVRVSLVLTCTGVLLHLRLNPSARLGVPELAIRDGSSLTNEHEFGALRTCKDGGMSFTDRTGLERLHIRSGLPDGHDTDLTGGGRRATGGEGRCEDVPKMGRESVIQDMQWHQLGEAAIEEVLQRIDKVELLTQGHQAVGTARKAWGQIDHQAWDYFGRRPSSSFIQKKGSARTSRGRAAGPNALHEEEEEDEEELVEGDDGDEWARAHYREEEAEEEADMQRLECGGIAWKGTRGPSQEAWEDVEPEGETGGGDDTDDLCEDDNVLLQHLEELKEQEEEEERGGDDDEDSRRFASAVELVARVEQEVLSQGGGSKGAHGEEPAGRRTVAGVPVHRKAPLATIQKAARTLSTGLITQSRDRLAR